ncbi:MAG: Spy/CpxP family protein refolding chaperone [Actinomycetota bacterium]
MKKLHFLSLVFVGLLIFLTFSTVNAQEPVTPDNQNPNTTTTVRPFKIFEELGLTREQIQQIRRINQERKPIMQEAQLHWREANRNLDSAIYSDNTTDEEVQTRMKEAQIAQTDLIKARALTEYQIRKILTPEQLIKFRQLREQLMQRINELKNRNNQNNPNNQQQRPINRLQQRKIQNKIQNSPQ